MRTIAMANMKGGTGKTSLSVSIAAELAKESKTLLLDFDPQGNTTAWTAPDGADMKHELADILLGKAETEAAIIPTDTAGLFLLPTFGIGGDLKNYVENAGELQINKAIKNLIADIARQGYQFCIIDLSPSFGKLERATLIAANETITPILADSFSMDGLHAITTNLADLQSLVNTPIALYNKIIINAIDGRIKRHSEIVSKIKAEYNQFTSYAMPVDQVFFRAQINSATIQTMDAKTETLNEISRIAKDLREAA